MASILPATKWGAALDFLTYQEVRTTLFVSKMFRMEAVQYVQVLSTSKHSELDVPSAGRFPNISHVNMCIATVNNDGDTKLCRKTATKMVPFRRLRHLKFQDDSDLLFAFSEEQRNLHSAMFEHLIGAIQSRALPPLCEIPCALTTICKEAHNQGADCDVCDAYCKTFPFWNAIRLEGCVDFWSRLNTIQTRPGGNFFLRENSFAILLYMFGRLFGDDSFRSASSGPRVFIITFNAFDSATDANDVLKTREFITGFDANPREISTNDLFEALGYLSSNSIPLAIYKSAFDLLVAFGINIGREDFPGGVVEDGIDFCRYLR